MNLNSILNHEDIDQMEESFIDHVDSRYAQDFQTSTNDVIEELNVQKSSTMNLCNSSAMNLNSILNHEDIDQMEESFINYVDSQYAQDFQTTTVNVQKSSTMNLSNSSAMNLNSILNHEDIDQMEDSFINYVDSQYAQTTTNVIEEVNVEAQRLSPETGNFRNLFNNHF